MTTKCTLPGDECLHDAGCDTCPHSAPRTASKTLDLLDSALKTAGFDGLYWTGNGQLEPDQWCGCRCGELQPCDNLNVDECMPGYLQADGKSVGPYKPHQRGRAYRPQAAGDTTRHYICPAEGCGIDVQPGAAECRNGHKLIWDSISGVDGRPVGHGGGPCDCPAGDCDDQHDVCPFNPIKKARGDA